jgi:hypothetical protein
LRRSEKNYDKHGINPNPSRLPDESHPKRVKQEDVIMKKHVLTLAICSILATGVFAAEGSAKASVEVEANMRAEASSRDGAPADSRTSGDSGAPADRNTSANTGTPVDNSASADSETSGDSSAFADSDASANSGLSASAEIRQSTDKAVRAGVETGQKVRGIATALVQTTSDMAGEKRRQSQQQMNKARNIEIRAATRQQIGTSVSHSVRSEVQNSVISTVTGSVSGGLL